VYLSAGTFGGMGLRELLLLDGSFPNGNCLVRFESYYFSPDKRAYLAIQSLSSNSDFSNIRSAMRKINCRAVSRIATPKNYAASPAFYICYQ
jgi:hypothetical protein